MVEESHGCCSSERVSRFLFGVQTGMLVLPIHYTLVCFVLFGGPRRVPAHVHTLLTFHNFVTSHGNRQMKGDRKVTVLKRRSSGRRVDRFECDLLTSSA